MNRLKRFFRYFFCKNISLIIRVRNNEKYGRTCYLGKDSFLYFELDSFEKIVYDLCPECSFLCNEQTETWD